MEEGDSGGTGPAVEKIVYRSEDDSFHVDIDTAVSSIICAPLQPLLWDTETHKCRTLRNGKTGLTGKLCSD